MEATSQKIKTQDSIKKDGIGESAASTARLYGEYRKQFWQIIRKIESYTKSVNKKLLSRAYKFAFSAHKNKLRKSGKPYIEHCIETAKILAELKMDTTTIAAGLLHDVVEDTGITIDEVREEFGEEIALLVDGVTKISELKFKSSLEKQAENFRKMIFSMAKDLRVILIKFADRLHNMRTIEHLSYQKARRIALETRDVYAPLAHRFGIAKIKWELEDLSLKVLDTAAYKELVRKVMESREERENYINRIKVPIQRELRKHGIRSRIEGRAKNFYSIYRKMKTRKASFEEIYDLLAIRIIVDRVDECYFALGVLHTLFTPIHDRFKDYIATPKLNMYQSLHTTVMGPEGKMVEIQIRTKEMHTVAEIGIAAHWKYKENRQVDDELDRYSKWLREMVDWQKDSLEPGEFMDILKTDLFISEIFVFSPKGDLFKLPIGSTPVDFAFSVHTDIGLQCVGAKVNGKIVPLNTELRSGDTIEIITSSNQRPSHDWLLFVKTSKAKSKIKRWLKEARYQEAKTLGEEILSGVLKRYKIECSKKQLKRIAEEMGIPSLDRLYSDLGQGEISIEKLIKRIAPQKYSAQSAVEKEDILKRFIKKARTSVDGIKVQGMNNLLVRFARCCHPVPGDSIIGFISKGRGIIVHRRSCPNVKKLLYTPERTIEVEWDVDGEYSFMVQLKIMATGRKEFLKEVAETLSTMNTNIIKVDMNTENNIITAFIIIEVRNLSHLTRIMRRLYSRKGILSIERESGLDRDL